MTNNITELASHMRGLAESATMNAELIARLQGLVDDFEPDYIVGVTTKDLGTILDALEAAQAVVVEMRGALATCQYEHKVALARLAELERALVYTAHMGHATPQHMLPPGVCLFDADGVQVTLPEGGVVFAGRTPQYLRDRYAAAGASPQPVAWPIDGDKAKRIAEKHFLTYEVAQAIARDILAGASPVQPKQCWKCGDSDATFQAKCDVPTCEMRGQPSQATNPMTAERAAYFMRRFKREEKLLGPNEQTAIDYVIALLEQPSQVLALSDDEVLGIYAVARGTEIPHSKHIILSIYTAIIAAINAKGA